MNASWAVRIIGGRALPSFPQSNHDCAVDWKVLPMARLRKKLMKQVGDQTKQEIVTLVGTRYSESTERSIKMAQRGDSHEYPVRNKNGDLVFSAIADWDTDDVWEWIGLVRSGLQPSYSDFEDLRRIYADSGGTSCAVVSDAITEGAKKARGDSCGARTGCVTCVAVKNDKSLTAMLEGDPKRYGYMAGANKLREFIVNTQWDFGRRQCIGRTIDDDGMIAIRPDVYSPAMCLELLRYALSIDADERESSYKAGLSGPRLELVSIQALVAIDCLWSLQGMHKPFQAIKEYIDIVENGIRYAVPEIPEYPRSPMPASRYLYVGKYWDQQYGSILGLRNPILEMVNDPDSAGGCMGTRTLKNGKIVMDVETESTFDVDLEGAYLALEFEIDRMMEMHNNSKDNVGLTRGYLWWVQMGVVSLSPQQVNIHDNILQRTYFKERMGIAGPNIKREYLLSLVEQTEENSSVSEELAPADIGTTEQIDLFSMLDEEEDESPVLA
nr:hypothetical protein [Methylomarinum sp. Ch1-1]MDP4523267.1 hypothetical protein [Methylomarinum sp. Ch1-1]